MLYFAYGSNMNREQMSVRCPNSTYMYKGRIPGVQLDFRKYLDISRKKDSFVEGVIWKIHPADIKSLDRYEGYPLLYGKKKGVAFVNNERIPVFFYRMTPGRYPITLPTESYLRTCLDGCTDFKVTESCIRDAYYRALGMKTEEQIRGQV